MARRELRDDEVIQEGDRLVSENGYEVDPDKTLGMSVKVADTNALGLRTGYRVFRDEPDEPAGDPGTIDLPAGTVIEAGDQYWCPHTKAWVASSVYNFGKRIGDPGTRAYGTGEPFRYRRLLPKPKYPPIAKKGDPVAWAPPTREELENARRELSKPTPTVPPYSTSAPCVICGRTDADLVLTVHRAVKVCPTHTRLERVKAGLEEDPYTKPSGTRRAKRHAQCIAEYEGSSKLDWAREVPTAAPLTILGPDGSGDDIAADWDWRKR